MDINTTQRNNVDSQHVERAFAAAKDAVRLYWGRMEERPGKSVFIRSTLELTARRLADDVTEWRRVRALVLEAVESHPGESWRTIVEDLHEDFRDVYSAREELVAEGLIHCDGEGWRSVTPF